VVTENPMNWRFGQLASGRLSEFRHLALFAQPGCLNSVTIRFSISQPWIGVFASWRLKEFRKFMPFFHPFANGRVCDLAPGAEFPDSLDFSAHQAGENSVSLRFSPSQSFTVNDRGAHRKSAESHPQSWCRHGGTIGLATRARQAL
jgi:hypothetical protein